MRAVYSALLATAALACAPTDGAPGDKSVAYEQNISVDAGPALGLNSPTFGFLPVATTVVFTCNGVATQYDYPLHDTGGGVWTVSGKVRAGCNFSSVAMVSFRRSDMAGGAVRTVASGGSFAADDDGGASYRLTGATAVLEVVFWGAETPLSSNITVAHDANRLATNSFVFDGGNNCPTQSGTYILSPTADEITIHLPQTVAPTAASGSGDASFLSASYDGSSTESYRFSLAALNSVTQVYTATVGATWAGGNSCGGTLSFVLDHLNFDASATPPDVSGLTHAAVSATEIQLGWTTGGGSTVRYKVVYTTGAVAPPDCSGTGVTTNNTGMNVTGLATGTMYSFRVCAQNIKGTPDLSAGVAATETTL